MGKTIGKGAEAVLSLTRFKGKKAVVKKRIKKNYRHPLLDQKLRKNRTRREERVLRRLNENKTNSPLLYDAKDCEIIFSFEKGIQAKNAELTKEIMGKIALELAKMHDLNIAHGDFTTSNILIDGSKVKIIDFGLSLFTQDAEDFATDLVLFEKTVSAQQFALFLKAYASKKKNSPPVIERFTEIKQRGRYVER